MLLEGREGRADLAEAAVDDDQLREGAVFFVQARVATADHFLHRAEVVVAFEGLDLEATVAGLVRLAVDEAHHRRDRERARDVRDVEALRRGGRTFEAERGGERGQGAGFVAAGQGVLAKEATGLLRRAFQRVEQVAQAGGLLVVAFRGGLAHVGLDLFAPRLDLAFEERAGLRHARGVFLGRHHVGVLLDLRARVVVEFPGAVGLRGRRAVGEEDAELLAHLVERAADRLLVGERAEVAAGVGRAGADDAEFRQGVGEVDPDLGELLVVAEEDVPAGAPALDQLPFEQEGLGLGPDLVPFHVGHRVHHRGHLGGHPLAGHEIRGQTLLEVLGLAHIDDQPRGVLHEVDARGMGGTPGLGLGRKFFPVGLHFGPGPLILMGRPVSANAFLQQ